MRTFVLAAALACCAAPALAQHTPPPPLSAEGQAELAAIRQATARYADVRVALAEGFIPDPTGMCVDAKMVGAPAELGGMGLHYVHPARLGVSGPPAPGTRLSGGDATLDWAQPEVLVYEPQADGSLQLVAAEYMVFRSAWEAAGNQGVPTYFGTPFFAMEDDPATPMDEAHTFEPHYELHLWVHRENPLGAYMEFNPAVTCPAPAAQHNHGGH